jgi:hypothetical protein
MVVMMVRRSWSRKLRSEFEAEILFFGLAVIVTAAERVAAFVGLVFVAILAFVAIAPDVVALELTGLVPDG